VTSSRIHWTATELIDSFEVEKPSPIWACHTQKSRAHGPPKNSLGFGHGSRVGDTSSRPGR
jgi:hypothetical protein